MKIFRKTIFVYIGPILIHFLVMENKNMMEFLIRMKAYSQFSHMENKFFHITIFILVSIQEVVLKIT